MKPEIIIHNSISLDGSLTGFMPDMELHYQIASEFKPDAHLIGSSTIITGNEMFGERIPEELPYDFEQPERDPDLPWWIIVDSRGRLKGKLHTCRRFEFCKDVILLVSKSTSDEYIEHIEQRNYRYIRSGTANADLEESLDTLNEKFSIRKILTDTGSVLGNLLINKQLVSKISVLIHPVLIGSMTYPMFSGIKSEMKLKLMRSEKFQNGCTWNVYEI
jgi:2,5-diamino-6-(ribosylamino)-4(3H)-pyrimidinone 5'-phosphate reductase